MKRLLVWLLLLGAAVGQQSVQSTTFTATSSTSSATLTQTRSGIGFHKIQWTTTGTVSTCAVKIDSSTDGISWNDGDILGATTCTSAGLSAVVPFTAAFVRVRTSTVVTGSGSVFVVYSGFNVAPMLDPCQGTKAFFPISVTANTKLVTGTAGKRIFVCSINLVTAGAENIALVEGTGATCGTNTAGMTGGATAATGWNFAANGGLTQGNGTGAIAGQATAGDDLCIFVSAAGQKSGVIGIVVQ